MNFEFFAFLVFMSFVSFAVAFLAYGMVVRFMGKDGFLARMGQIILVPACIVIYDFITMAAPPWFPDYCPVRGVRCRISPLRRKAAYPHLPYLEQSYPTHKSFQ